MAGDTLVNKLKAIYKHMMLVGDEELGSDGYFLLVVTGYIRFFDASVFWPWGMWLTQKLRTQLNNLPDALNTLI